MSGKQVVFLNGPMGVGKTTVGRLVQKALFQSAFIDGDWCLELESGARAAGLETPWFTLLCTEQALKRRWLDGKPCPWRTEENLKISIGSLETFRGLPGVQINTAGKTPEQVRNRILALLDERLEKQV